MPKVVLVTGASRGIGAATALAAAAEGWSVMVNYRRAREEAEAIVSAIRSGGGQADSVAGDVSDEADVRAIFAHCIKYFGRLDGLVNNAGILREASRLDQLSLERWSEVFAVNVTGTFLCSREAVRLMSRAHGGHGGAIVNLSSMAAVLGAAGEFIDYAASKGAIESMTLGLAREVGGEGIRVNAARPGLIATDIHSSSGDADRAKRLVATVPLGRVGTADEVSRAVVWLLSEAASYVNGSVLTISGGR